MTNTTNDKRHFHRIFFNSDVTLNNESTILPCKLVDISLKLKLSDEISITMQTSVAHVVGSSVGFKCEHIDIDSISQLRRLVELNLGDSDLLERDLLALTEFKES